MRKAAIRVASVLLDEDHRTTTVLTTSRTTFLNDRMYGSSGTIEVRVSRRVAASERLSSKWWTEVMCDLRRGVNVRYFFESVASELGRYQLRLL